MIDIALLPEHRGRGVGTQLVRALLAEANAGGRRVTLNVERSNRARGLYERLGFQIVRDGEVYVDLEWIPPDAPGEPNPRDPRSYGDGISDL